MRDRSRVAGAVSVRALGTRSAPVIDELEHCHQTTSLVAVCIGGSMGIATILERV